MKDVLKVGLLKSKSNELSRLPISTDWSIIVATAYEKNHFYQKIASTVDLDAVFVTDIKESGDRIDVVSYLHQNYPDAYIVYFPKGDDLEVIFNALSVGAKGIMPEQMRMAFFNKNFETKLLRNEMFIPPQLALKIILHHFPVDSGSFRSLPFTPKELSILHLFHQNPDMRYIAQKLNMNLAVVKTYFRNILKRVDWNNYVELSPE